MLKASMRFCKSLERCIGNQSHQVGLSNHFYYLAAKDSFLNPQQLTKHYRKMEELFKTYTSAHPDWNYLGTKPMYLTRRISDKRSEDPFGKEVIQAAFEIAEYSVDTEMLGK